MFHWAGCIFQFFTSRSLCSGLFILVQSMFALAFQRFTCKHCLQILGWGCAVLSRAVEPEPKQFWMAGASVKKFDGGVRAWNLGSGSTALVCGEGEFYQYYNGFWFSMDQIILKPEPKTSRYLSRSQNISTSRAGASNLTSGFTALVLCEIDCLFNKFVDGFKLVAFVETS